MFKKSVRLTNLKPTPCPHFCRFTCRPYYIKTSSTEKLTKELWYPQPRSLQMKRCRNKFNQISTTKHLGTLIIVKIMNYSSVPLDVIQLSFTTCVVYKRKMRKVNVAHARYQTNLCRTRKHRTHQNSGFFVAFCWLVILAVAPFIGML